MREADRWLEFARQDLRVAELAMSEGSLEDGLPDKEEAQEASDLAKKVLENIGAKL